MGKDRQAVMQEEELCQFNRFTREDALALGLRLHENAKRFPDPVAIEISINGLTVFRYFPEGTAADNGLWLARKRNVVELMEMSSLQFKYWLAERGETLTDRKLEEKDYAACGGGFPLRVRGTGMVGTVCVSGLPDLDDHQLIVDTITEYLRQ